MKPFSLERAKAGDKVVNQDGKAARIICFDKMNNYYPIVALVTFPDDGGDYEMEVSYSLEGENDGISLHMAPVKRQAWVNVYNHNGVVKTASTYDTEHIAKTALGMVGDDYIKTILLHEWEE